MTNNDIVFQAEQELAKQGIIKYSGPVYTVTTVDGKTIEYQDTERLHTFQTWKSLGYIVRRGEKSVIALTIWKHISRSHEDPDGNMIIDPGKMFPKKAYFFSASQVDKI